MKKFQYSAIAAAVILLSACSGTQMGRVIGEGDVTYEDSQATETVNANWGSTDLQNTAESMAQSLLASRWISKASSPPKVRLREVKNYTDEHIDTKGITDKIRIKLLNSGQVRFLADKGNLGDVFEERDLNEAATRRQENKLMMDTDYIVTGAVRSIKKRSKNLNDTYYQITLELTDPQSGEIKWADEKEIRKVTKKSTFGW